MKVKLLLLEGVEKEIDEEVRNQLGKRPNLSEYDKILAEIKGQDTEQDIPPTIYVDMTKYFKITDFYFRKEDVVGLFLSTKEVKEQAIMVIITIAGEYDCIFDEQVFDELKEFLND